MKPDDMIPLLDELGFIGMKEHITSIIITENSNLTTEICLALHKLLMIELEYKKSRSLNYRLKLAKFPSVKLLEDTKQAHLVSSININDVVCNQENILLIGGSGSAKTHLAIGLAYVAIKNGYRAKFYTLSDLASRLIKAKVHN